MQQLERQCDYKAVTHWHLYAPSIQPSSSTPGYLLQWTEQLCSHKSLCISVHRSFSHNCPNLETTKNPSTGERMSTMELFLQQAQPSFPIHIIKLALEFLYTSLSRWLVCNIPERWTHSHCAGSDSEWQRASELGYHHQSTFHFLHLDLWQVPNSVSALAIPMWHPLTRL